MNIKKILIVVVATLTLASVGLFGYIYFNNRNEEVSKIDVEYSAEDENTELPDIYTTITLKDDNTTIEGSGATVKDNIITITSGGAYLISGTLLDGQIIVDATNKQNIQLFLNGVNITTSDYSPISIAQADKTIITLMDNSTNILTDSNNYILASGEDEPNATLFSKDDLTINGSGTLKINANYNNGITSKDDLKIIGGNIDIASANHGIKGKDLTAIKDSNITVTSLGDGIKSTNDEDLTLGYVSIENSNITINTNEDGIQAQSDLAITNSKITITSGGGSANSSSTNANWGSWKSNNSDDNEASAKGLKADNNVIIEAGTYTIDSSDDAIHSNNIISIKSGTFTISSGDDAIHADSKIDINADITITKSYEGIESAIVNINGGNISIISSDDGINAGGGSDSSATGRPGQNNFTGSVYEININGGNITIDATGDGIDSNQNITITGGNITIYGPITGGGDGAIDYDGTFNLNGGSIIGVGMSGMNQMPSSSSTQNTLQINLTSTQSAGTKFSLTNSSGEEIASITPNRNYQNIVVSTSILINGDYNIYLGDTLYQNITISSNQTTIGTASNSMPNGRR